MKANVLADIENLLDTFYDTAHETEFGDSERSHEKYTYEVLQKLVEYIRNATWSDNETLKFVARNFTVSQTNLPELWCQMFPDKPEKADSTFRVNYQNINNYLRNVLPVNLVEMFVNDDKASLESLSRLIDSLYINDKRIETQLGSQLCYALSRLTLPSKKFDVGECLNELQVLRTLSVSNSIDILDTCDEAKLAYVYYVLTRPSVIKGKLNETRLNFVKHMVNMDSGIHIEQVSSHVVGDDYVLLGIVKNICDLMQSDTNVQKVQELVRVTLKDYASSSAGVLLDGLRNAYQLISTGNELSATANILKGSMAEYIGVTEGVSTQPFEAKPKVREIKVFDLESKLTSDKAVIRLLKEIKEYCEKTGLTYPDEPLVMTTGGLELVKQLSEGVEVSEDAIPNPDVINFLHLHCTKSGIRKGLSKFSKEDVAYVLREMDNGNKDFISAVRTGINVETTNYIGDVEMCEEAKHIIESVVLDAEPSDYAPDSVVETVRDYTLSGMKSKLEGVSPADLAKVYDDILSNSPDTMGILRRSY